MKNKLVSLSDELFDKLKAEENGSELIRELLENHYGTEGSMAKLDSKVKQAKELMSQEQLEDGWKKDIIKTYQIYHNGKEPKRAWVEERLAHRRQQFTDDIQHDIR